MSLDDVLGAASKAEQEGKDRVADARAASDATSAEHEKTMRIFAEWVPDAVRRLAEAVVPHQVAVEGAPEPPPRTAPPRPGLLGRLFGSAEAPPPPAPGVRLDGWTVYACGPATPERPDGVIRRCLDTRWGEVPRYGDRCDGYITNQALFLTSDARAIVVAASYPVTGVSTLNRHYEKMMYTTTKPWATVQGGLFTPGASAPQRPEDRFVRFVGRDATTLSALELYELSATIDPTGFAALQDHIRTGQLVEWELGVRFAISRAAQGLSTTPYPKPG